MEFVDEFDTCDQSMGDDQLQLIDDVDNQGKIFDWYNLRNYQCGYVY